MIELIPGSAAEVAQEYEALAAPLLAAARAHLAETPDSDPADLAGFHRWVGLVLRELRKPTSARRQRKQPYPQPYLDLIELLHRTERALAAALHRRILDGRIGTKAQHSSYAARVNIYGVDAAGQRPGAISQYVDSSVYNGSNVNSPGIARLWIGVDDEAFEAALKRLRGFGGHPTRAGLIRLIEGAATPDVPPVDVDRPSDYNPARVISETLNALDGLVPRLALLQRTDYRALDPVQAAEWRQTTADLIAPLHRLRMELARVSSQDPT